MDFEVIAEEVSKVPDNMLLRFTRTQILRLRSALLRALIERELPPELVGFEADLAWLNEGFIPMSFEPSEGEKWVSSSRQVLKYQIDYALALANACCLRLQDPKDYDPWVKLAHRLFAGRDYLPLLLPEDKE